MIAAPAQEGMARVLRWLLIVLMVAMTAAIFTQVFSRYVLQDSIPWTEEVARYILVYITFVGGALAVFENTHLKVELVVDLLSPRWQRGLHLFSASLIAMTAILLIYYGGRFTWLSRNTISPAIDQPLSWIYAVMPLAGVLMLIFAVLQIAGDLVRGRSG